MLLDFSLLKALNLSQQVKHKLETNHGHQSCIIAFPCEEKNLMLDALISSRLIIEVYFS